MLGPKIHLKSIKNQSKNNIKKSLVFWLILCWFLLDFGSKLGGPRGSNEPAFRWLVGSWGQDSPKRPPRAPQEPPKSPPRASKTPPRGPWAQIFGRFLIDFGCIFGKCFVDLWSIFDICFNICGQCFVGLLSFQGTVAGMAEGNWIRRPRRGAAVWDRTPELSESSILVSIDN